MDAKCRKNKIIITIFLIKIKKKLNYKFYFMLKNLYKQSKQLNFLFNQIKERD